MAEASESPGSIDREEPAAKSEIHEEKEDQRLESTIESQGSATSHESNDEKLENHPDDGFMKETKLLRDTLDLLWNQTVQQRNLCQELERENEYLQEYIGNLMTSSNVLEK